MSMDSREFTCLLQQAEQGNKEAANRLFRQVEDQLRAIAQNRKAQVHRGVDLSTTAIIDEAFCMVVGQEMTLWETGSRAKFFRYVATQMHDLLIEAARAHAAKKRGGDLNRVSDDVGVMGVAASGCWENVELLLDLQSALDKFEAFAANDALIFRLRYFLGSTFDEIAEMLSTSATSVKRSFERARSWLSRELKAYDSED